MKKKYIVLGQMNRVGSVKAFKNGDWFLIQVGKKDKFIFHDTIEKAEHFIRTVGSDLIAHIDENIIFKIDAVYVNE